MNANKNPKLKVKLGEQNELKFRLTIKGTTSDPGATKPQIRFSVTETKTGISIGLPMVNLEEGLVGVTIPDLPQMFQEGVEYTGNVEVVVGSRWFNPASVGLVFERDMQVQASPLQEETDGVPTENIDEFASVIKPETSSSRLASSKGFSETAARDALFSEHHQQAQTVPQSPLPTPTKALLTPKLQDAKKVLKGLLTEAWADFEE